MGLNDDNASSSSSMVPHVPPAEYSLDVLMAHAQGIGTSHTRLMEELKKNYDKTASAIEYMTRTQVRGMIDSSKAKNEPIIMVFLKIFLGSHDQKLPFSAPFGIKKQTLPDRGTAHWKAIIQAMLDENLLIQQKNMLYTSIYYDNFEILRGGTDPVNDPRLTYYPVKAQAAYDNYLMRKTVQVNFVQIFAGFLEKSNQIILEKDFPDDMGLKVTLKKLFQLQAWAILSELVSRIEITDEIYGRDNYALNDFFTVYQTNDRNYLKFKNRQRDRVSLQGETSGGLHRGERRMMSELDTFNFTFEDTFLCAKKPELQWLETLNLSQALEVYSGIPEKFSQIITWESFDAVCLLLKPLAPTWVAHIVHAITPQSWETIWEFKEAAGTMLDRMVDKLLGLDLKDFQQFLTDSKQDILSALMKAAQLKNAKRLYIQFHEAYQDEAQVGYVKRFKDEIILKIKEAVILDPTNNIQEDPLLLNLIFKDFTENPASFMDLLCNDFDLAYQYFRAMTNEEKMALIKSKAHFLQKLVEIYSLGSQTYEKDIPIFEHRQYVQQSLPPFADLVKWVLPLTKGAGNNYVFCGSSACQWHFELSVPVFKSGVWLYDQSHLAYSVSYNLDKKYNESDFIFASGQTRRLAMIFSFFERDAYLLSSSQAMLENCLLLIKNTEHIFEWAQDAEGLVNVFTGFLLRNNDKLAHDILMHSNPRIFFELFIAFWEKPRPSLIICHEKFQEWVTSSYQNRFYPLDHFFKLISFPNVAALLSSLNDNELKQVADKFIRQLPHTHEVIMYALLWLQWLIKEGKENTFAKMMDILNLTTLLEIKARPYAVVLYSLAPHYFENNHPVFFSSIVNDFLTNDPVLGGELKTELDKMWKAYSLKNASAPPITYEESIKEQPPHIIPLPDAQLLQRVINLEYIIMHQGAKHDLQMNQLIQVLNHIVSQDDTHDLQERIRAIEMEKAHLELVVRNQQTQINLLKFSQITAPQPQKQCTLRRVNSSLL